ncbi:MAG: hypothetical protein AB1758_15085 [Candidatus Eremiobacterota bacterium]
MVNETNFTGKAFTRPLRANREDWEKAYDHDRGRDHYVPGRLSDGGGMVMTRTEQYNGGNDPTYTYQLKHVSELRDGDEICHGDFRREVREERHGSNYSTSVRWYPEGEVYVEQARDVRRF